MSKDNKAAFKVALAYLSFIVGAGFTTGQELLQFFVNHGNYAYIAVILTGIIVTFATRQTSKIGYVLDANTYEISLNNIFGKFIGRILDYLTIFFLLGLTVVMIAGGGSALYQGFDLPIWAGSLAIVILLFIVLQLKFNGIMVVLSVVTPFLVIAVLIIAGYNIINPTIPFSEVNKYIQPSQTSSSFWWWDALVYGGLIIGNSFGFLTIIGCDSISHKAARRGSFYGGLSFSVLLLIMTSGLLANIQKANSVDIPTLLLANDIHPLVSVFMSAVMIGVIFNGCVGMLYTFLNRFTKPKSKQYVVLLSISLVVSFLLSFIGFVDLVNFVFKTFGYIGLFISATLLVRWVYNKFSKTRLM
ncbi:YkvI family membrane protein [Staphylococcus sp. AS1337]|uniref:YkvI family membrane protein n=1 Tax=Staphylococcus sp. AS1337 TaxID=3434042 RepID=UPI003F547A72